jgi:hypothetical protein
MSRLRRDASSEVYSERKAILEFLHDIEPEVTALDAVAAYLLNVCIKRLATPPAREGARETADICERPSKSGVR